MTDRAARKRRTTTTMPPVEPTPQKPAVNEGAPQAGHPGLVSPVAARMAAEGEWAKAPSHAAPPLPGYSLWRGEPNSEGAPYQLPDGTWEVLTLDADGRVTARRTVEGPK